MLLLPLRLNHEVAVVCYALPIIGIDTTVADTSFPSVKVFENDNNDIIVMVLLLSAEVDNFSFCCAVMADKLVQWRSHVLVEYQFDHVEFKSFIKKA